MVGVGGFEPPTPCSRSRCANRTALHPDTDQTGVPDIVNGSQVDTPSAEVTYDPFCEKMVGVTGFEPVTTSTPRRCASGLRHTPTTCLPHETEKWRAIQDSNL